ncbi:MAG: hypothetical protein O3C40_03970 [Planctomycetota bacterium]|nr:hypothetical protein [Planctomycetota bacterium]
MAKNQFHFAAICSLFLLVSGTNRSLSADESGSHEEPYRVWVGSESNYDNAALQFAVESDYDSEFYLVQEGAADATATTPSLSRSEAVAARRRRSTYRLPNMFGDYFGGSILQASVLGPPVPFQQRITDGQNGFNFFVTNANGGPGADPNFAVPIQILNGGPNGNLIASSVGNGVPQNVMVVYPTSDPTTTGFAPPPVNGPGFLAYQGGTATGPVGNGDGWILDFGHTFTPIQGTIPVPSGGVAVRRFKLSENNSPMPRDRFIANYNFFNDVIGGIGDVNRYAFGFERTFLNGSSSIEVLFPFASTLAADQVANGVIAKNTQFGDIPIILKTILAERDEYVLAGGVGVTIPTGSDARVFNTAGNEIIHVDHASVHLLPYLALARAYDSGWYWQSFLQMDVDVNGNNIQADLSGANLQPVGVLQEQTLLFADLGVGYQFTQLGDDSPLGIAATAELHYATPLQNSDSITAGTLDIRNLVNRFDVVNLTLGMNFLTNRNFSIRPAMVIPLSDDQFDYEAMVQANYFR